MSKPIDANAEVALAHGSNWIDATSPIQTPSPTSPANQPRFAGTVVATIPVPLSGAVRNQEVDQGHWGALVFDAAAKGGIDLRGRVLGGDGATIGSPSPSLVEGSGQPAVQLSARSLSSSAAPSGPRGI